MKWFSLIIFLLGIQQFILAGKSGNELDVNYYEINLAIEPGDSSIRGEVYCQYTLLDHTDSVIFHLFPELILDSVKTKDRTVRAEHVEKEIIVFEGGKKGEQKSLVFFYHGKPIVAKHAPWDGGLVWDKDSLGRPFVGVACEGLGASSWWPNHDQLWDKADSMSFNFRVAKPLQVVCNGVLENVKDLGDTRVFSWKVNNPIINYNATFYVGNFSTIEDTVEGLGGTLPLTYYVLDYNATRAQSHFAQVKPMLATYEKLFGPYPFYEDGYKLVEAPYLGMEHQSAIAYGNAYQMGYRGRQIPEVNFDYIIIHETGHEYWGNNLSMESLSDMWIHESFCTYTEVLYVEEMNGIEARDAYLRFCAANVAHTGAIIPEEPHQMGDGDMYHKGALMLHLLRQEIQNDSVWFHCLKQLHSVFRHQTVSTQTIIDEMNSLCQYDVGAFLLTYLKKADPPVLQVKKIRKRKYELVWTGVREGFSMHIYLKNGERLLVSTTPLVIKGKIKKGEVLNSYRMFAIQYE